MEIREATFEELPKLLKVQKLAFVSEAELHNDFTIQPLTETIEEVQEEFNGGGKIFLVIMNEGHIIGGVRVGVKNNVCSIHKMVIHTDFQCRGLGSMMMKEVEKRFPDVMKYELFTAEKSEENVRFYKKLGYEISGTGQFMDHIHKVFMEKVNNKEELKQQ